MKASTKVLLAGHQPFCPWIDFHFQLMLEEHESLTVEDYYRYSISWLEVADVMVVLDGWKKSSGTIAEVDRAKEIGIPIFFGVEEFLMQTTMAKKRAYFPLKRTKKCQHLSTTHLGHGWYICHQCGKSFYKNELTSIDKRFRQIRRTIWTIK